MAAVVKEKPAEPAHSLYADSGSITLPLGQIELCAAKGDIRAYLNHPFLDLRGDKPMLVATNGHILAAAPVEIEGKVSEGPLPIEAIKLARRRRTEAKSPSLPTLYFYGDMVGNRDVMFRRPVYDFTYPDWRKVVPEIDTSEKPDIGLNADYMALAQKAVGGGKYHGSRVYCGTDDEGYVSPDNAVLVKSTSIECREAFAIVMPLRV